MIDSLEKLAQSCTFVVRNGEVTPLTDKSGRGTVLLSPGSIIDCKYEIVRLIGQGGMGAIYKVHHMLLQKDMALKTFRSHGLSQDSWQRFQREAQAIAKLHHKNIIDVFDFGIVEDGLPYYTMELLTGQSLADVLQESGRLDLAETLTTFGQVADALGHAHRQNIVHRDIKPANIILVPGSTPRSDRRQAKLVDFGIAKLAESSSFSEDQSLTRAGTVFGSPLYMSPEQSLALPTDNRTDMYSFGCALFEALTGKPPFVGNSAAITMLLHQRQAPTTLNDAGTGIVFPQRLEALIAKLLAKLPENRYHDFAQIKLELDLCYIAVPPELSTGGAAREVSTQSSLSAVAGEEVEALPMAPGRSKRLIVILAAVGLLSALPAFLTLSGILRPTPKQATLHAGTAKNPNPLPDLDPKRSNQRDTFKKDKPYLIEVRTNPYGNKEKVFDFAIDANVGSFLTENEAKTTICRGTVLIPANQQIVFVPDSDLCANSELFQRFGQANLYGIKLTEGVDNEWSNKHIEAISRIPGLEKLDISGMEKATQATMLLFDKMTSLKAIDVASTNVTGNDLVDLKILPNIEELNVSELKDLSKLWKYLASHPVHLKTLVANHCHFSPSDFAAIGKIEGLQSFTATHGEINGSFVTDMIPATHLQTLNLIHNPIDNGIIKHIGQYKELKTLYLSSDTPEMPAASWNMLRKVLADHCKLVDTKDGPQLETVPPQQTNQSR